jgi:hypothetical protein
VVRLPVHSGQIENVGFLAQPVIQIKAARRRKREPSKIDIVVCSQQEMRQRCSGSTPDINVRVVAVRVVVVVDYVEASFAEFPSHVETPIRSREKDANRGFVAHTHYTF